MIAETLPNTRRLVREILRIERGLRRYDPRPQPPPPRPDRADEVLAALAALYPAGSQVGYREIESASGCSRSTAFEVRRWAQHRAVRLWPYRPAARASGLPVDLDDLVDDEIGGAP